MFLEYDELIKSRLKEKRYVHSVNVAKKAAMLSEKFGGDVNRAYLAGLLHDICKNDTNENILKLFDEFGIMLDNVSLHEPKLWHAIAGAAYVEKVLKINDSGVVSAIRYHTTGKANMTLLEKVVFLADFISDDRDYDGVDKIRQSLDKGLDFALLTALQFTICDLCGRSRPVHIDSINAYNQLLVKQKTN